MKKVLITAYAVNPYKGSEDAMGWHMLLQAARYHTVIAVTRKNNRMAIEKYIAEHTEMDGLFSRLSFLYFDWPKWMLGWKKGPLLSMIYYYGWQLTLALWLKRKKLSVDLVHNLNFHNDWTPSFLWILGKPMVWGHVGHHPKVPKEFLLPVYGKKAYFKDRLLWLLKNFFWNLDPLLYICKRKADVIICMNDEAVKKLRLKSNFIIHPSVAADQDFEALPHTASGQFRVLSVGRFVPLKGFDLTIRSFAKFYKVLPSARQHQTKLTLVGSGPCKKMLHRLVSEEGIDKAVEFIDWLPRDEVKNLYQSASVLLFPSHEGAGMVVPEAMSYGLPVLCLKNCGPGEMLHPNSGLAIPYSSYAHTVTLLAEQLSKLFFNKGRMIMEKNLSAMRYDELFRWDVRGEMLKKVYQSATGIFELVNLNQHTYVN
jgi:glycosyltransferase involved in cell wall biosynthesis